MHIESKFICSRGLFTWINQTKPVKSAGDHPENAFKTIQQIGSITFFRKPIAIAEKILYHQK